MQNNNLPRGIRRVKGKYMWDVTYQGMRRTGTCNCLNEALSSRHNMLEQMKTLDKNSATLTFQDLLKKVQKKWEGTRSLRTSKINALEVVKFFGKETPVESVSYDDIEEFKSFLKQKGNSNATINRKLAALSKMLTIALDGEYLLRKPKIERLPEYEGRIRFITINEERKILTLLRQWGKIDHAEAVQVLLDTGMRTSELWKLKERDVALNLLGKGQVTLWDTKNGKNRVVPMTSRVREILRGRMQNNPERLLFPYSNDWMIHVWNRVKHAMSMDQDREFVPHCLRHTFASRLVQRHADLLPVQKLMGHSSLKVTMRYAHLIPISLISAIDKLENLEKVG